MASLLITAAATNSITERWLAERVASCFQLMGYLDTRADVERALSRDGLPCVSLLLPDPGARDGRREFLITVEEMK